MYQVQGLVPKKRHTVFKKPDGSLLYEELISREGFSGIYSNLYHLAMPTRISRMGEFRPLQNSKVEQEPHRPRHIKTASVRSQGDIMTSRRLLFYNEETLIYKAHPTLEQKSFYRNGHFDELIFVQSGRGRLDSQYGTLEFSPGDYLVIPRGVIIQMGFHASAEEKPSLLIVESPSPIQTPKRYRNGFGQLMEHSPFCERDIRAPRLQYPVDLKGEFLVTVRLQDGHQDYYYDRHPFDVVGWDGYHFPWAFNIHDFEPVVGRIHQPPPVHQTFESAGFVVCSFVTRPFDFHPDAVPAPYPHSNVDSDEILFYSAGQFMSRKGIFPESITYHPMGIAHGPQPGRYEESIGKKGTEELAVMIDTFRPLRVAPAAIQADDPKYPLSWTEPS